jgi:pentapeptide MXKDX repeat protein
MFKGLQTGTTQAQAVITTQANLPDNSPIPPAFLTKLYNLKKGKHSNYMQSDSMQADSMQYDSMQYDSMQTDSMQTDSMQYDSMQADSMQYDSANNSDGYLIRGIPHTKLTNPQSTYAAFSGPSIPTKPTGPAGNPTFPGGRIMTNSDVQMEKNFNSLNKTYNNTQPIYTNPTTTSQSSSTTTTQLPSTTTTQSPSTTTTQSPSTTTPSPSTTSISHFSNMNSNMNNKNMVQEKIKNNNKDIENIALGFVTVIILLFLVVIFNTIRNSNSATK